MFATARQLARLVYRMLRYGHDYVDIGEQAYEAQFQMRRLSAITESARDLGYTLSQRLLYREVSGQCLACRFRAVWWTQRPATSSN